MEVVVVVVVVLVVVLVLVLVLVVVVVIVVVAAVLQSGVANAVMVGRMNIRQLRVRSESCQTFNSAHHQSSQCFSTYSEASHDNSTFGSYQYYTAEQTGSAVYHGHFGLYGGDGYLWSFPAGYERYGLYCLVYSRRLCSIEAGAL